MREFIDEEHQIEDKYFKIIDKYTGKNDQYIIPKLNKLIEMDPFYFDSYNFLVDFYYSRCEIEKGNKIINQASKNALQRILDRKGNWPDRLEWGWIENRHIIRAIVNQAILYWKIEKTEKALNLFRNLLRTNPNDNVGARYYILGIRLNISFTDFELRFNKNGFYDFDIVKWFDDNYKRFPDEFEWWNKEINDDGAQVQDNDVNEIEDDDTEIKFYKIENIFDKFVFSDDFRTNTDIMKAKKQEREMASSFQSENFYEPRIFQLKITIKDIKPPIWRRILISNHTDFHELHLIIQEFFNWGNYHLHEFHFPYDKNPNHKIHLLGLDPEGNIPNDVVGEFLSYYDAQEDEVRLYNVFSKNCRTVGYLYDFGDNWDHSIKLEKVYPFKKEFEEPVCVAGKRASPPEDCGGSWGYQELLEILKNKRHPEYDEIKEWVGSTFNPEKMDVQIFKMTPRQIEEKFGPIIPI